MLFDSHCHLDFAAFDADRGEVLQRAEAAGISDLLIPGFGPHRPEVAAAAAGPRISVAQGLHPHWIARETAEGLQAALERVCREVRQGPPVAIGECGLDASVARSGGLAAQQAAAFETQLRLAAEVERPVIVHSVRAHGAMLATLKAHAPAQGGVIHAYSGPADMVPEFTKLGFYFGFGAKACDPRAKRARAALGAVPPDRLLLETDAPDQALAGPKSRNEPAALAEIAERLAALLGLPGVELAFRTTENAWRLFGRA